MADPRGPGDMGIYPQKLVKFTEKDQNNEMEGKKGRPVERRYVQTSETECLVLGEKSKRVVPMGKRKLQ